MLQPTMFALRTKHHITTKHTPYYLMFGREARYPSQIPMEYEIMVQKVERLISQEAPSRGLREQDTTYSEVSANNLKSQEKVRQRKRQRGEEDHFHMGDLVLVKNARQEQSKGVENGGRHVGSSTYGKHGGKGCRPRV
ncbi:hypothetical protein CRENBAI_014324 [Crenichthys baileyi]|uniref:Uncharacterized protein n=1 Tax=Crenichthys baileyi TaxID=28760 RepID=A0AAV9SBK3_9TELE